MATMVRGRAASPIRPGFIVRDVLSGKIPLDTGEIISEAAITDLHSAYKGVINRENAIRPRATRLKGMTYRSFITFFKFSYLLGLVEKVREEPMRYPPPGKQLYRMEMMGGEMTITPAVRKIYRLTTIGAADERSWSDLRRAWQEQWVAPQKLEIRVEAPPVEKPVAERPLPKKRPTRFPTLRWVTTPTLRQFSLLLDHLERLNEVGAMDERVIVEMDSLSMKIGDWELSIEDSLAEALSEDDRQAVEKYVNWASHIAIVREGFIDRNLEKASRSLRELVV